MKRKYKKLKRIQQRPKPRVTYVTFDMGSPVVTNGLFFDPKTGECALLHNGEKLEPKKVYVETGYERTKGYKRLNKAQISTAQIYSNPNRVLENFDVIYAIDTNCKIIDFTKVFVTCVVGGTNLEPRIPGYTAVRYGPRKCIEFLSLEEKFENLGWKIVIDMIRAAPNYNENQKVALIVDSDLGNIELYNTFSKPIYDKFYLPKNFQLIYASSDSGKENLANQMISLADKSANMIFDILLSRQPVCEYEVVDNKPYSHIRIWEPARKKTT